MAENSSTQQNIKILVIDDDWLNQELMEGIFSTVGYTVLQETTGQNVINIAMSACPNIIILDVRLPKISGFEICATLRNHIQTAHIPIIMISGHKTSEDELQARQVGADAFLERLITTDELLNQVNTLLHK